MLEDIFLIKECIVCHEVMPLSENVCDCGGGLLVDTVDIDKKRLADYYHERQFLRRLRGGAWDES